MGLSINQAGKDNGTLPGLRLLQTDDFSGLLGFFSIINEWNPV
jgi:hypothetical protein